MDKGTAEGKPCKHLLGGVTSGSWLTGGGTRIDVIVDSGDNTVFVGTDSYMSAGCLAELGEFLIEASKAMEEKQ